MVSLGENRSSRKTLSSSSLPPSLPVTWSAWQCVLTPNRHCNPSSFRSVTSLSTVRSTESIRMASLPGEGGREGGSERGISASYKRRRNKAPSSPPPSPPSLHLLLLVRNTQEKNIYRTLIPSVDSSLPPSLPPRPLTFRISEQVRISGRLRFKQLPKQRPGPLLRSL